MCGASAAQKNLQAQQAQMYQTLNQSYATNYAQQQNILNSLTSTYMPILKAGQYQAGYSPAQETGLNTAASENIGQQYASAAKTLAAQQAAAGGDTFLPSSIQSNQQAALQQAAASQRASALNENMLANYNRGYTNWQNAASALSGVSTALSPTSYAGESTAAGSAAGTTANAIAQQSNSIWNAAIGAVGGVGGVALGSYLTPKVSTSTQNLGQVYSNWGAGLSQPISTIPVGQTQMITG